MGDRNGQHDTANDPRDPRDPLDAEDLSNQVCKVAMMAMGGDRHGIADVFIEVSTRYAEYGHHALYAMCCGLAELVIVLGEKAGAFQRDQIAVAGENAFFAMEVCDITTDEQVNPDEVGAGARPIIAGHRFVVAVLNDDLPMALDLFTADPVNVCTGLAMLAGAFGKHAHGDSGEGGGG